MKRSRSGQPGFAGLWRRCRFHSATAISAMPIGMPGWPDLAASTASIDSARIALASSTSVAEAAEVTVIGWELLRRYEGRRAWISPAPAFERAVNYRWGSTIVQ